MAGFYPDVPSYRMAYDSDGTGVFHINEQNAVSQLSAGTILNLNDESTDFWAGASDENSFARNYLCFIFPEKRNVSAYFAAVDLARSAYAFEGSSDTTNGVDGTWSVIENPWVASSALNPYYRTGIRSISAVGVIGLRFGFEESANFTSYFRAMHFYGTTASGENPDRLRLWQPTTDAEVGPAFFDWADIPRGTTADKQFRIKNNSSTLTANDITVTTDAPTNTTPSLPPQFTYSINGGPFATSISIPSLAAGALSSVITVRRTTPSNATLSLWVARTIVDAASFS